MELKQYQIVLVNLDPTVGSEMQKTRPCVIISPNEMNKHIQTIVVAPMTRQSRLYPTRVEVNYNNKAGWVVLDQIRTIDRLRVIKYLDSLTPEEIEKVKLIIKATYVD